MKKNLTNAQRVARSQARAIAAGARRVGPLLLQDQAAIRALDALAAQRGSIRAAIEHALRSANKSA